MIINQLLLLFMSQPQGGQEQSNPWVSFLPFILIIVVIYFFMIRPQARKAKEQKKFKEQIQKGDKVVTIGGIHAKVLETKQNAFVLDIGNNQKITVDKGAISMDSTKALQGTK